MRQSLGGGWCLLAAHQKEAVGDGVCNLQLFRTYRRLAVEMSVLGEG